MPLGINLPTAPLYSIYYQMIENSTVLNVSIRKFKGIYLSKALSCVKFFLYKKKLLFYQGHRYLWPHCWMDNLYISHRSLYTPTYSFWAIGSMLISLFRVTSGFDTVCNIVTHWPSKLVLAPKELSSPGYPSDFSFLSSSYVFCFPFLYGVVVSL